MVIASQNQWVSLGVEFEGKQRRSQSYNFVRPWSTGCWNRLFPPLSTVQNDQSSLLSSTVQSIIHMPFANIKERRVINRRKFLRCVCRPFQECVPPARQQSGFRQSQILWQRIQYMYVVIGCVWSHHQSGDNLDLRTLLLHLWQSSPWPHHGRADSMVAPHRQSCKVRCYSPSTKSIRNCRAMDDEYVMLLLTSRPHWKERSASGTSQSSESQSSLAFSIPFSTAAMPARAQKSALLERIR